MKIIDKLQKIAEVEFSDIVIESFIIDNKLRIILNDKSIIDVNVSQVIKDKFGFHWETKNEKIGNIYRYDNFPDTKWKKISSYPYHFHQGSQNNVVESPFSKDVEEGFEEFMKFVQNKTREIN